MKKIRFIRFGRHICCFRDDMFRYSRLSRSYCFIRHLYLKIKGVLK